MRERTPCECQRRRPACLALALLMLPAMPARGGPAASSAKPRAFEGKCYTIPKKFGVVAMFDALLATEDGKVYMGTSTYTHGAQLLELDRETGAIRAVVDLEQSLKQHGDNAIPHSKIHTHLTRSKDGVIYFGTHTGRPDENFDDVRRYEGGHFMSYDPRTGTLTDYGIGLPGDSLMRVVLDEARRKLYAMTFPKGHLLVCDLGTRVVTDMGKAAVSTYSTPWVLSDGKVYFASRLDELSCFDPNRGEITVLPLRPPDVDDEKQTLRFGNFSNISPDRSKLYGSLQPSGQIVEWDLTNPPGRLRRLGGKGGAMKFAFAPDGKALYFHSHAGVCKYDLRTERFYGMGTFRVGDERLYGVWGACTAPDGKVFFGGNLSLGWKRSAYGRYGLTSFFEYDPARDSERQKEIWSDTLPGQAVEPATASVPPRKKPFARPKNVLCGVDLNQAVPYGESAVRAMIRLPGGALLAATAGRRAHLVRIDPATEAARDLGLLPDGEFPCYGGLALGKDGTIVLGTTGDVEAVFRFEAKPKGALYRVLIGPNKNATRLAKLVTPSPDDGLYCMAMHPEGSQVYALTFPGGKLLSVDVKAKSVRDYGLVAKNARPSHYALDGRYAGRARAWTYIPLGRALVFDHDGILHGSAEAKLFRLGPGETKPVFHERPLPLPGGGGFYTGLHKWAHGDLVLDALVLGGDGRLYGGTRRGYLFCLDLKTEQVVNLGKPLRQGRVRALCWHKGAVYGIGGEEHGRSHLFRYRSTDGFSVRPIPAALSGYWMHFYCNHYDVLFRDSNQGLWLGGSGRMTDVLKVEPW